MMHFGKKGAVNYQYFPVREIWDVGVFGYVYIDAFHTSPFPSALINFFTGLYVFALFLYFSSKYFEIPVFSIGYVAIDVDKIKSSQDEKYIIAHEIGHIETGAFYNIYIRPSTSEAGTKNGQTERRLIRLYRGENFSKLFSAAYAKNGSLRSILTCQRL